MFTVEIGPKQLLTEPLQRSRHQPFKKGGRFTRWGQPWERDVFGAAQGGVLNPSDDLGELESPVDGFLEGFCHLGRYGRLGSWF